MSEELVDKHQILLKGGEYKDKNVSEDWLNFLTDPANLQPGLPNLTVNCFGSYKGWNGGYYISVSFDETKASLRSIEIRVGISRKYGLEAFQETDPQIIAANSNPSYLATNPHHLKQWIFNLFLNSELEHLDINFLIPELPDLFDQLPRLKTIVLKKTKLVRLPPSFFRLANVIRIDLSDTEIAEVPHELGNIQSLESLIFTQPCPPSTLGRLHKLTTLTCRCPRFNIPEDITGLTALKYLTLTDVATAPDNLLNFPSLEFLFFHAIENPTVKFSSVNVPALKEVNTNQPAVFTRAIAQCKNLEYLITGGKALTKPEAKQLTDSLSQLDKLSHVALPGLGIVDMNFCLSMANLKWIDLSDNAIKHVPAGMGTLHKLLFLDLSNNAITHVPTELNTLYQAGQLNLKGNPLVSFPDLDIRNEAKQKIIQQGGTHKLGPASDVTLVEWLTFLTNPANLQPGLPDLTINSSLIVSFDSWKPSLRSLKLELRDNELSNTNLFHYPDSYNKNTAVADAESGILHLREWVINLFQNTELEELRLPFQHAELPDLFNALANLKSIDLSRSKLSKLPPSFCQLHALEVLKLTGTPLTELPDKVSELSKLVRVDLSRTLLTEIPTGFFSLTYLKELQLEGTSIVELPDHFNAFTRLKTLSLNTSNLKKFPLSLFQLSALENLRLDGTSLTELPDRFDTLTNLKNVSINITTLTQLPPSFFLLTILEDLNLDGTSIAEFPDRFDTLTNLKDASLRIPALKQLPLSFFQLKALENLNLEETSLTGLPDRFDLLINLKKISFNRSKVAQLPPSFFLIPALEWLDLKDSSITELPADLGKLSTLKYLAFSQPCDATAWPGLTELTELYCDCPDFFVPMEFSRLVKLKKLCLKSVYFAAYESMNLPELEILEIKINRTGRPLKLQGDLPKLKRINTNYHEAFGRGLLRPGITFI